MLVLLGDMREAGISKERLLFWLSIRYIANETGVFCESQMNTILDNPENSHLVNGRPMLSKVEWIRSIQQIGYHTSRDGCSLVLQVYQL